MKYQLFRYLLIRNLQSSFLYQKPFPDSNFCLDDCKFGGNVDLA